jgi:hypothetical protein
MSSQFNGTNARKTHSSLHNYATMSMISCDVESQAGKKGSNGMKIIVFNFYPLNEIMSSAVN